MHEKGTVTMPDYFETGFCVRTPSWHGKETLLAEAPKTWAEARKHAGLEWEVAQGQVYEVDGMNPDGTPHYAPIDGWKRIYRDDTMDTLAVTSETYTQITHEEMGQVMEEILATTNLTFETGGVLEGGRKVWALLQLDEPVTIPGDSSQTLPYFSVTNRHDSKGSFQVQATAVRIVCANTWHAAELEGDRTGTVYSFKHTANWRDRVEEAREAVLTARRSINRYLEIAEHLLTVRVTAKQRELFIHEFFPMPPVGMASDCVIGNVEASRDALRAIMASDTTAPVAHTAYGLIQAAGEYMDHVRVAKSWETKLNRSLLGAEKFKGRAVHIARAVAGAAM